MAQYNTLVIFCIMSLSSNFLPTFAKPSGKQADRREYLTGLRNHGNEAQKALAGSLLKGNRELQSEDKEKYNIDGTGKHAILSYISKTEPSKPKYGFKESSKEHMQARVASAIKDNPELQSEIKGNIDGKHEPLSRGVNAKPSKPDSGFKDSSKVTKDGAGNLIKTEKEEKQGENDVHNIGVGSKIERIITGKRNRNPAAHDNIVKASVIDRTHSLSSSRSDVKEDKPRTFDKEGSKQNVDNMKETINISQEETSGQKTKLVENDGKHNTDIKGNKEADGNTRKHGSETEENSNRDTLFGKGHHTNKVEHDKDSVNNANKVEHDKDNVNRANKIEHDKDNVNHTNKVEHDKDDMNHANKIEHDKGGGVDMPNKKSNTNVNKKYTNDTKIETDDKVDVEKPKGHSNFENAKTGVNKENNQKSSHSETNILEHLKPSAIAVTYRSSKDNHMKTTNDHHDANVFRLKHNSTYPATSAVTDVTRIVDASANELNQTKKKENGKSDTHKPDKVGVKQTDAIQQATTPDGLNATNKGNEIVSKSIVHSTTSTVVTTLSTKQVTEMSLSTQSSTTPGSSAKSTGDEQNKMIPELDTSSENNDNHVVRQGEKEGTGTSLPCINMRDSRRLYDGAALLWAVVGGALLGGLGVMLLYYLKAKCNTYIRGDYSRVPLEYDFELNPRLKTS